MSTLQLGSTDRGKKPADTAKFFEAYHKIEGVAALGKNQFRGEMDNEWLGFTEVDGELVKAFQDDLRALGFPPDNDHPGIFGYATRSAARLFQEYVKNVEGDKSENAISVPSGIVGPKTLAHVARWKAENKVSDWSNPSRLNSPEYMNWLEVLEKMKSFYQDNPNPLTQRVSEFTLPNDTLKLADWKTDDSVVHLIGIRASGSERTATIRENEDLFVLLINGLVFKFWGSTSPNRQMSDRATIPFLIEGQHRYNYGWHKVSSFNRVYPALRTSAGKGVLVVRDLNTDNIISDEELAANPLQRNETINIHWSGDGDVNWSAGCQVIAGKSYVNHLDKLVDCSAYAAGGYSGLARRQTRGAYNVLADLIVTYAPVGQTTVYYSLISERRLKDFKALEAGAMVEKLKGNTVS